MGGVCECVFMFVYACMQVYLSIHANKARGCRCWVSSLLFFTFFVCLFSDTVLIYGPGWPGTRHVDQAALKLSNGSTFVSQVLELKLCASTPDSTLFWDMVSLWTWSFLFWLTRKPQQPPVFVPSPSPEVRDTCHSTKLFLLGDGAQLGIWTQFFMVAQ